MLTQQRLKEFLHYDPETGVFTWLVSTSNRVKVGAPAISLNNYGYSNIRILKKAYAGHRLAFLYMTGELPIGDVDHINGIRNDNRWGNLRLASRAQNLGNMRMHSDNTVGLKGVSINRTSVANPFVARIVVGGKRFTLGSYPTAELAHAAYCEAAQKHYGEFARAA